MNIAALINNGINQFIVSLTKNLPANEAAAIGQIVRGIAALVEAEAINRGGPALLGELAKKYPTLAAVISQVPELRSIVAAM